MSSPILDAKKCIGYDLLMPWYFIKPTPNIGQDKLGSWECGVPFAFSSCCSYPNNWPKESISERKEIILSFNWNSHVIYYSKYLPKNGKRKTFRLSDFPTLTQLVKYGSIIKDLCIQIDWSQRTTELMEIEALLFLTSLE